MKRIIAISLLALSLGGCAKFEAINGLAVTQTQLDATRATYATYLTGANQYVALPLCATGTHFALKNQCSELSIVRQMQADDSVVNAAFGQVQTMITSGDNTGLSGAYNALQIAMGALKSLNPKSS